jgi:DNA-binding response OmpR family regulator
MGAIHWIKAQILTKSRRNSDNFKVKGLHQKQIRVLIADDDNQLSRRLADHISDQGFDARVVNSGKDARAMIADWKPRFVLADLMLPEGNALSLIDFIKSEKNLRHQFIHVLVMSGHNVETNVRQSLDRGAKDYIVKPFRFEDVVKRLVFHSRSYKKLKEISAKEFPRVDEASLMLHLTDLVLRQALGGTNLEDILFNLTRMVSLKVDGVRCSIVQCLDQKLGLVVTSNDDRDASGIQLDLYKYPEILHVLNTRSLVAIENLSGSAELRHVREKVKDIAFNSLIVCPISRFGQPFGVLSLRMPPEKETVSDNEIRFVEIVSHVVSLVLSNQLYRDFKDFWVNRQDQIAPAIPLRPAKNS